MSEKEFEEAFSDENFVNELLNLKTGEQVRNALAKKGIVLTPEELDKFAEVLVRALEKSKMSEEELKNCSGGSAGEAKDDLLIRGAEILVAKAAHIDSKNIEQDSFLGSLLVK